MDELPKESTEGWNWENIIFIAGYHIALLIALPLYLYYRTPGTGMLVATGVAYLIGGIGITAGYHRYYAHKAFEPSKFFEPFLLFMGTLSVEGSVLRWACNHRMHHNNVDDEGDPYNIKKGFWHAHILWIFKNSEAKQIRPEIVPDLMKNKWVQFQHKHYLSMLIFTNVTLVGAAGWLTGDWFGAIVFVLLARLFFTHHSTWFINSLAHTWGEKPFSREHSAVNNFIISLLSFGEGYHNYHHTFPGDYRNGVRWYQFDITKYFIWVLEKLGIVKNVHRVNKFTIKKKIIVEDKRLMLEKLASLQNEDERKKLEPQIDSRANQLIDKLQEARELIRKRERHKRKNEKGENESVLNNVRTRLRELRKSIQSDWKEWWKISREVDEMTPASA